MCIHILGYLACYWDNFVSQYLAITSIMLPLHDLCKNFVTIIIISNMNIELLRLLSCAPFTVRALQVWAVISCTAGALYQTLKESCGAIFTCFIPTVFGNIIWTRAMYTLLLFSPSELSLVYE